MIWDKDTVRAVRQMGAKTMITDEALRYGGRNAREAARDMAWKSIRNMGHTYALDIQREDIRMLELERTKEDYAHGITWFAFRWLPETNQVVFLDGPGGGTQMGVPKDILFFPIHGTEVETVTEFSPGAHPAELIVPVARLTYIFAGWDEHGRTWVYKVDPKSREN